MKAYWIVFDDGTKGCCEGESSLTASAKAEELLCKKVLSASNLPYPAQPLIWQYSHPSAGKCPPFCYQPDKCIGHRGCPRDYACSD